MDAGQKPRAKRASGAPGALIHLSLRFAAARPNSNGHCKNKNVLGCKFVHAIQILDRGRHPNNFPCRMDKLVPGNTSKIDFKMHMFRVTFSFIIRW